MVTADYHYPNLILFQSGVEKLLAHAASSIQEDLLSWL